MFFHVFYVLFCFFEDAKAYHIRPYQEALNLLFS